MNVYIKGMEMPTSCGECRFCGEYCYAKGDENKYSELPCPLVSVPEHGRLIDADELEYYADNVRDPMGRTEKTVMWKKIEAAPTIIPADRNEP